MADKAANGHSCFLPSCSELLPREDSRHSTGTCVGGGGILTEVPTKGRVSPDFQGWGALVEGRVRDRQLTQHQRTRGEEL